MDKPRTNKQPLYYYCTLSPTLHQTLWRGVKVVRRVAPPPSHFKGHAAISRYIMWYHVTPRHITSYRGIAIALLGNSPPSCLHCDEATPILMC